MDLYGGEGLGKSTLGFKFPKPLVFNLEDGAPRGMQADAVSDVGTYPKIMTALKDIHATENLAWKTILFDGKEVLEALIHKHVCNENRWANMESPGYGKGFVAADVPWHTYVSWLGAIRKKHGTTIILIGHQTIERIEDPRVPAYTAYAPRLHKRARSLIVDTCDIVGFLAQDVRVLNEDTGFGKERTRATASPSRYLFLEGRPAFTAKNRYGMPEKIEITKDFDIRNLTKYFTTTEAKEGSSK
jgi:hypothetical protein